MRMCLIHGRLGSTHDSPLENTPFAMEFVLVNYPQSRSVLSGGNLVGPTSTILSINEGTHTFTLSGVQDYLPQSLRSAVAFTSSITPLNITFTPVASVLAQKFPAAIFDGATSVTTVDNFIAQLQILGLSWQIEKNGEFGTARAQAVFDHDTETGEAWVIATMEQAVDAPHRHGAGGPYGELLFTLAGELEDIIAGNVSTLGVGSVAFHAPETTHMPRARRFWAGLYHRPRGVTAV